MKQPQTPIQKKLPLTTFEDSKSRLKTTQREKTVESTTTPKASAKPQAEPTMSNPTFSQFQQNVQRQSREQKAVGSLLSGVAVVLIGSIVLVAILASFGGWMLYKRINEQSVTVAQLETKLSADIQNLNINLQEANVQIQNLLTQAQAQKQQVGWLQGQVEDLRNQSKKSTASLQDRLKKIEGRIYDIERENIR
jgi:hypothetical protein